MSDNWFTAVLLHWAGIIFFSYPDNIKKEGGAGAAE